MTNAGFSTRYEDRAVPRWISASVLVGAAMVAMVGLLTVTSGSAVRSEPAAAGAAIDHAVGRSGTLVAHHIVY